MATRLDISTDQRQDAVWVSLRGELDLSSVGLVDDVLERVESDSPPLVVLDLSRLGFLDSTGLRCVVTADERARNQGRRFAILKGPEAVHRVFAITRLEERLDIVDDESALSSA